MYYVSLVLLQNFGRAGRINPYFSVWIPNIILFILAIYVGYKTQKEIPFRTLNTINEKLTQFWEYLLGLFGLQEGNSLPKNPPNPPD